MARALVDPETDTERLGCEIFEDFKAGKMIYQNEFRKLWNYLSANIVSDYSPNRGLYYHYYNLMLQIKIVARWRRKHGRVNGAKLGERVCYLVYSDGVIINLNEDKKHLERCYRCR